MNKYINQILPVVRIFLLVTMLVSSLVPIAYGQSIPGTGIVPPDVNLSQQPQTENRPFGAFKLLQCDGPAQLDTPATHKIKNDRGEWVTDPNWRQGYNADGTRFVPCDFRGAMMQMQFLINVMIVLGVVVAIIGIAYAGFLFLTGTPPNIKKAKEIFPKIVFGFIIMLVAWFAVYQILNWLTGSTSYLQ